MRIYKFRGKSIFDGRWVYGLLRRREGLNHDLIEEFNGAGHDVDTKTVSEFTGLLDKNGKEIYEGDITKDGVGNIDIIVWHPAGYFAVQRNKQDHTFIEGERLEVIGNIFENPELIK